MTDRSDTRIECTCKGQEWVSGAEAARLLGVHPNVVAKMVKRGLLTTRHLPASRVKISREDVLRIALASIRVATKPAT